MQVWRRVRYGGIIVRKCSDSELERILRLFLFNLVLHLSCWSACEGGKVRLCRLALGGPTYTGNSSAYRESPGRHHPVMSSANQEGSLW